MASAAVLPCRLAGAGEKKTFFFFFLFRVSSCSCFMPVDFVYLFRELSCACEQLSCDAYMVSSVCDEVQ
jgi:hypothetical protein